MIEKARARELIAKFADKRILVIGDLMLDEFLWGKVSRISPEAPVPVVDIVREEFFPGGAANVARNLAEFTSGAALLGVTGDCQFSKILRKLLIESRIDTGLIEANTQYQTIVKSRVIARHQHVVRIDREQKLRVSQEHRESLLKSLTAALPRVDAIILEDYGKGLLAPDFAESICSIATDSGKLLTIDPNPNNYVPWFGATVVKPNRSEAFAAAGVFFEEPSDNPLQDTALQQVTEILLRKWKTAFLVITLGEQGMLLAGKDGTRYHAPSKAREVFDVSGAGDTVIALLTLALSAGATAAEAAEIANHASGIVVGKLGTATVQPSELLESFEHDLA